MPLVGETLAGRYRIDAALGSGATAVVYRAHDLRLGRDVAVKVLLANLARDPLVAGRFDREARALAAASNPGIVAVHDVDHGDPATGREPFFVMELCDGGSLADALDAAGGRLAPEALVPLLATVAGGLASLHERGVVHRDVKPQNVLICGGEAKLGDFGLARSLDTTRLTAPGTAAGTLAYLAPELLSGAEPGPAADMYALGVVAYQGLTGMLPRPATSMVDLVDTRLAPVSPVSAAAPDLGTAFDEPVGASLAAEPSRRPPASSFAGDMHRSLDRWQAERHVAAPVAVVGGPNQSTQRIRLPPAGAPLVDSAAGAARRRSLIAPVSAAGAAGILAAGLILVMLQAGGPGTGATPSPSGTVTGRATATTSPSPTRSRAPSPTPAPTRAPTPVPTPLPTWSVAQARAQLATVYDAIQNAEDTQGLSKKDVMDLRHAADAVNKALDKNDDGQSAAKAAEMLSRLVQQRIDDGKLAPAGDLMQAVSALASSLPPAR